MKIRIYSGLHLEFGRFDSPFTECGDEELVILAGDIAGGTDGVAWAARMFPHVPVVYVLGNHEFYGQNFDTLVQECKIVAQGSNVHVLERDVYDYQGVCILGTTLWTDFAVYGESRIEEAMDWAGQAMNDFCLIQKQGRVLTSLHTKETFTTSADWLDRQIASADRPVLVVTHHAPTLATMSPYFKEQISNAAFHSNAQHLLRAPVRMWIHGHTHYNADALVNGVRVTSNQWGYPDENMLGFRRDGVFILDARP
ncbi:metallophosphoesterase [Algiphilus aromaticivorans]|uniref:metallophosphoesterase n=1 Tax=Algiphilus aromaticivorans TaxID=382454 RepID=UPI0005C1A3B8|nr:metallophosphoesterase [Algiphilus aromaticivorans]